MKRICLVGVKGIGKTYLIYSILDKIPNIDFIIGSDVLKILVSDDERDFSLFDNFPEDLKQTYRENTINYMIQRQKEIKKDILVDGHTTLFNPNTDTVQNVFTDMDCRFYSHLILYETSLDNVLNRRREDLSKNRILDPKIIEEEMKMERKNAEKISKKYGIHLISMNELDYNSYEDLKKELISILEVD